MQQRVNPQNSPFEVLHVNSKKVACDGGKSESGHPTVYLNMGEKNFVVCPYCSKYFTIEGRNIVSTKTSSNPSNSSSQQQEKK